MKSVHILKRRLSKDNILWKQNEGGLIDKAGFIWNEPATEEEIKEFERENKLTLPATYKDFLKISNGAVLFKDIKYGQWGCRILGLGEITSETNEKKEDFKFNEHSESLFKDTWIVFASWIGDGIVLAFDLNKYAEIGNDYVITGDELELPDEWEYLKGNFAEWLDRFIVAQGTRYWFLCCWGYLSPYEYEEQVVEAVKAFKSRLSAENTLFVQNEGGVVKEVENEWHEPVSEDAIIDFERSSGVNLPEACKVFLKISNGAVLFKDRETGRQGCRIHGLNDILQVTREKRELYKFSESWIVFATWLGDNDLLAFDMDKYNAGERHYIIYGEPKLPPEKWKHINGEFAIWIDQFLINQGSKFWQWC